MAYVSSKRKENSSEIPAHGIYRSVKRFLQPIKLREISIILRRWNYNTMNPSVSQSQNMQYSGEQLRVLIQLPTSISDNFEAISISNGMLRMCRVVI